MRSPNFEDRSLALSCWPDLTVGRILSPARPSNKPCNPRVTLRPSKFPWLSSLAGTQICQRYFSTPLASSVSHKNPSSQLFTLLLRSADSVTQLYGGRSRLTSPWFRALSNRPRSAVWSHWSPGPARMFRPARGRWLDFGWNYSHTCSVSRWRHQLPGWSF